MPNDQFDDVVLSGTTYKIPKADANPPYGEELNDYLKALGEAFSTLVGVGDIQETAATINNNQSSPATITGLSFDPAQVRSAAIEYQITRSTSLSTITEAGVLTLTYNPTRSATEKWNYTRESSDGDSEVVFYVADNGTVSYTSSNMAGTGYTGIFKFQARALLQS